MCLYKINQNCRFITDLKLIYCSLNDTTIDLIIKMELKFIVTLELSNNMLTALGVKKLTMS